MSAIEDLSRLEDLSKLELNDAEEEEFDSEARLNHIRAQRV